MTAQPDPTVALRSADGPSTCADCGGPMDDAGLAAHPFPVCQACYDAYVDNAGR